MSLSRMTKKELVELGVSFHLSLNISDTKKNLIAQIEQVEGHTEFVPGEGFVWVKSNRQKGSFEEDEPTIKELKRETKMLKNSLNSLKLNQEIRLRKEDEKEKIKSDNKIGLVFLGLFLLFVYYLSTLPSEDIPY